MATPRTVLLVHGAWHGAWCWAALQAALDRRGVPSLAVDLPGHATSALPLGDLHGDATHVAEVLARIGRGTVLVGHSYGGAVITQAASRVPVTHLVYLAAFCLDDGESVFGLLGSLPPQEVALSAAMRPHDDGTATLDPVLAVPALYGACPAEVVAAAVPRLGPQPIATFQQPVTGSPWRTLPSTYVVCTQDEAIHPAHQEHMAARAAAAGARVVRLTTDHSPFLSAVDDVADLLAEIAVR